MAKQQRVNRTSTAAFIVLISTLGFIGFFYVVSKFGWSSIFGDGNFSNTPIEDRYKGSAFAIWASSFFILFMGLGFLASQIGDWYSPLIEKYKKPENNKQLLGLTAFGTFLWYGLVLAAAYFTVEILGAESAYDLSIESIVGSGTVLFFGLFAMILKQSKKQGSMKFGVLTILFLVGLMFLLFQVSSQKFFTYINPFFLIFLVIFLNLTANKERGFGLYIKNLREKNQMKFLAIIVPFAAIALVISTGLAWAWVNYVPKESQTTWIWFVFAIPIALLLIAAFRTIRYSLKK